MGQNSNDRKPTHFERHGSVFPSQNLEHSGGQPRAGEWENEAETEESGGEEKPTADLFPDNYNNVKIDAVPEELIPRASHSSITEIGTETAETEHFDREARPETGPAAKGIIYDRIGKSDAENWLKKAMCEVGERYIELKAAEKAQQDKQDREELEKYIEGIRIPETTKGKIQEEPKAQETEEKQSEEGTNECHQDEEIAKRIIEVNRQVALHRRAAKTATHEEGSREWVRQKPKLTQEQNERIERNKEAAIKKRKNIANEGNEEAESSKGEQGKQEEAKEEESKTSKKEKSETVRR